MTTFAETMVTKYETLLADNVGVKSVSVDGQAVTYEDLTKQYEYWKSKVAREAGTKPRVSQFNMGGF